MGFITDLITGDIYTAYWNHECREIHRRLDIPMASLDSSEEDVKGNLSADDEAKEQKSDNSSETGVSGEKVVSPSASMVRGMLHGMESVFSSFSNTDEKDDVDDLSANDETKEQKSDIFSVIEESAEKILGSMVSGTLHDNSITGNNTSQEKNVGTEDGSNNLSAHAKVHWDGD